MLKSMSRPLARCVADDLPDLTAIEADILQFAVVVLVERIERGLALAIGQHLGNPAVDGATQPSERQKPLFAQTGLGKSVCHVRHGHGRLPWKRFGCQRRAPVLQGGSDPAVSVAVKKSTKAGSFLLRSELPHATWRRRTSNRLALSIFCNCIKASFIPAADGWRIVFILRPWKKGRTSHSIATSTSARVFTTNCGISSRN